MWSHRGSIIFNAARVYYVPADRCLPPLRWQPELQQFLYLDDIKEEDMVLRSALEGLTFDRVDSPIPKREGNVGPRPSTKEVLDIVSDACPCEALYGVLSIGPSVSALLYVAEAAPVHSLCVGGQTHGVFVVKRLEWMRLPSMSRGRTTPKNGSIPQDIDGGGALSDSRTSGTPENNISGQTGTGHSEEDEDEGNAKISEATISDYLSVIDRFCVSVAEEGGDCSRLYYSPTLNLALSPEEMLQGHATVPAAHSPLSSFAATGPSTRSSFSRFRQPHSTQMVFQWNHSLLQVFGLPSREVLSREGAFPRRAIADIPAAGYRFLYSTDAKASDVAMLYVPCFIRGVVQTKPLEDGLTLQLLTRLACRWAGTRYNRRGLEPGTSGVCANMAMTSLWLVSRLKGGSGTEYSSRTAVFNILRGSIPRRWEQPANLSFKPTIKISMPNAAVDELCCHVRLLASLLPSAQHIRCLDTTSTSKLEKPLSEAFALAVHRSLERVMEASSVSSGDPNTSAAAFLPSSLSYIKYDMKAQLKKHNYGTLRQSLMEEVSGVCAEYKLSFTTAAHSGDDFTMQRQSSYVRVNCLDCLDRTNLAQTLLAESVLPQMLQYVLGDVEASKVPPALQEEAAKALRFLFAEQGVALSFMYAHSDPHYLALLEQGELGRYTPSVGEGLIALRRWFHQNFSDGRKQDAVSLITRQHHPELFDCDIESPFSRDFSSMNRQVLYGVLFATVPLLLSLCLVLMAPLQVERRLHAAMCVSWVVYVVYLYYELRRYPSTYTNRPLLSYSVC